MTLTNHLLAGAVLSKFLPWPIAIPIAFASHFILDACPHFGFGSFEKARKQHGKLLFLSLAADVIIAALISWWLLQGGHWIWFVTGLVAYSPDVVWIYQFVRFRKVDPSKGNRFTRFHKRIQHERLWGAYVEAIYFVLVLAALH